MISTTLHLLTASLLAFASVASAAQLPPVDQISRDGLQVLQQISAPAARQVPTSPAPQRTVSTSQLTTNVRKDEAPRQLTGAAASKDAPAQVSSGRRSAEGAQPLSRPSDGRTSAVERLAGDDRCDPARQTRQRSAKCAAVIENRSSEFPIREAAPLSPEQRLLAEQRGREMVDPVGAARRLALGKTDADVPELQGVASVVLQTPPPEQDDRPLQEDSPADAAAAIIGAIISQGAAGAPPPN